MNISKSWKESISFLMPHHLKPFLLVTGKTVFDVYKSINKPLTSRGNWVVILVLLLLIGLTNVIKMFHLFLLSAILLKVVYSFIYFIFLLGMRPSVGIKDRDYFIYYIKKYWYFLLLTLVLGISDIFIIPFILIIYTLFLLFIFDGVPLLPAMVNSFKMVGYNFPVFIVLFLVLLLIGMVLYPLVGFVLGYFGGLTLATLLYILFVPIEIALITNLYIKFLHGQPALYFKQPE